MKWLFDTNVLSEMRRRIPDPAAISWIRAHFNDQASLSVVTLSELRRGGCIKQFRDPLQGAAIHRWIDKVMLRAAGRIIPVCLEVAEAAGKLSPRSPLPVADGLIAATALVHGLTLVTRNVRDFERSGVSLLNPWES